MRKSLYRHISPTAWTETGISPFNLVVCFLVAMPAGILAAAFSEAFQGRPLVLTLTGWGLQSSFRGGFHPHRQKARL